MALPPLPENNTDRLFIYYTTGGGTTAQEHVMTIRYNGSTTSPVDVMSDLGEALNVGSVEAFLFDGWQVLRAETQAEGSLFRFPIAVPGNLLAVLGAGLASATPAQQAREIRMIGRGSTSGRRVSLSLYGCTDAAIGEADFRFEPAAGTPAGEIRVLAAVLGLGNLAFINIGKGATTWYTYVNWQYNSHWETEQRA